MSPAQLQIAEGSLRVIAPPAAAPPDDAALAAHLLAADALPAHDLIAAMAERGRSGQPLTDILRGRLSADRLAAALGDLWQARAVDPQAVPPDPALIDRMGADTCLRHALLPWRRIGAATVVLVAHPHRFAALRPGVEAALGPVCMALATPAAIETAILVHRGRRLARRAETHLALARSCRGMARRGLPRAVLGGVALLMAAALAAPVATGLALTAWAALSLAMLMGLKLTAALASRPRPTAARTAILRPPVISLLVPLHREGDIAASLIRRLERLEYPRDRLEVLLTVEAGDSLTRDALAAVQLPRWMRVVPVPAGGVQTKPRALNHALGQARGEIIGIYDAEDAPAPDQLRRVAQRFAERDARTVCLQGVLDFYNPRQGALARAFTLDYGAWFRVVLPGLARLGLPIPLGGTTVFLRRAALAAVGGWDAHNVTEDADLGLRLARAGYRTELIDSTTLEEACCRPVPWVRQRSRWIKGYMMTWAAHMRHPRLLWRQLGPAGFLTVQALFLCALSQVLLAPLLWSYWAMALGLSHPVAAAVPPWLVTATGALFVASEGVNLWVNWLGWRRAGRKVGWGWLAFMPVYAMLATLAAYKALWELALRPFYWDKTAHGARGATASAPRPPRSSAASRRPG